MNKGDYMVHWSGKVCMVEDMAEMNLTGTKRMYFILTPVRDKAEKIYVPIEKTEGTLRPVLSRKEAVSLAGRIRDIEPLQIKDEKQRAQEYKTAYYSQDYLNLVRIAKELYQRKESRGREGKKLPSKDAQMMLLVEKTFEEEMAVALGVETSEVKNMLEAGSRTEFNIQQIRCAGIGKAAGRRQRERIKVSRCLFSAAF